MVILPFGVVSAPYLRALVTSSWRTSAIAEKALGSSITSGPTNSSRPLAKVYAPISVRSRACNDVGFQLVAIRRSWACARERIRSPPSSGPGPILSKLRRPDGTTIFSAIGDYTNPILLPQAAAIVEKSGARELSGIANPNPHNQCWPEPTPFILGIQMGMQLIQHKDEVILLYVSNNQVRRVLMNAPHSTHLTPTWQGESVGHYEGDTLVIDTIGQKVGPLSMTDRYGTPFSGALHLIERYRLIDGAIARDLQRKHEATYGASGSSPFKNEYGRGDIDSDPTKPGLQVEITVDDPGVFTTPWSAVITYRRVLGTLPEAVCAENMQGAGTAWVVLVPKAEKPAF
jgi:hypothetical protein